MRYLWPTFFLLFTIHTGQAQISDSIVAEFKLINNGITIKPCTMSQAAAISDKAMNIFLADKTSYVSERTDLSFYTNYVTLNSYEGKITVNHNFQNANGKSESIRKLFSVGISMGLTGRLQQAFLNKRFENELGVTATYKWLGKVKTKFADCGPLQSGNQKKRMDALRAAILHSLKVGLDQQEANFEKSLDAIDSIEIPGQSRADAKELMQKNFNANLKVVYTEKFAKLQAESLTSSRNFKTITTHWTSLAAYIPVMAPTYSVASSLNTPFQKNHSYQAGLQLSHTRLRESSTKGRLFSTLTGRVFLNNTKLSYMLDGVTAGDYKNRGGSDSFYISAIGKDEVYLGQFNAFITPSLQARLVYFPSVSHVGISLLLEQNIGRYHFLNGRLGVPLVLINNKKIPAVNIEFYALFTDISGQIETARKYRNKPAVGLGIGIPLSRMMY